ncbi:MAG: alpha/beta hydrolase [Bacteroidota bacterium]|nr:alpha/beta hydrolase [Bacteroidota bacterium]
MNRNITYKKANIEFSESGQGNAIVLLHGYIESLNVWEDFSEKLLEQNYKVISIDLPGHGNSEVIDEVHTMKMMADVVNKVLEELNIEKCVMIGHSMGGYVTMEFVKNFKNKIQGFCLFNSVPFSDSDEKKTIRDRLVNSIEQGKKMLLAKEHVEKTFATINKDKFVLEKGFLKIIAINTSDKGTIAALKGMKLRKDFMETFENTELPVLWVLGRKDNFISPDIIKQITISDKIDIVFLEKSGHQGFIEEKEKSFDIINNFAKKCYQT